MDAVTIREIKVKCDLCGWNSETDDLSKWFGTLCPECGCGEIINKAEEKDAEAMLGLIDLMNEVFGDVPDDSKTVGLHIKVNHEQNNT